MLFNMKSNQHLSPKTDHFYKLKLKILNFFSVRSLVGSAQLFFVKMSLFKRGNYKMGGGGTKTKSSGASAAPAAKEHFQLINTSSPAPIQKSKSKFFAFDDVKLYKTKNISA